MVAKHDSKVSLLCSVAKKTFLWIGTAGIGNLEGVYLIHDDEGGFFNRSGKVVGIGRNMLIRHNEHEKCAREQGVDNLDSLFYRSYPSKHAKLDGERLGRKGYFENLTAYCGLGFDRNKLPQAIFETDPNKEHLFRWDPDILRMIEKVNFRGAETVQEKQLHFVGYLLELCYDLALSSDQNVSRSPGFETPLGIFGN